LQYAGNVSFRRILYKTIETSRVQQQLRQKTTTTTATKQRQPKHAERIHTGASRRRRRRRRWHNIEARIELSTVDRFGTPNGTVDHCVVVKDKRNLVFFDLVKFEIFTSCTAAMTVERSLSIFKN
jgi:hypothetical protein